MTDTVFIVLEKSYGKDAIRIHVDRGFETEKEAIEYADAKRHYARRRSFSQEYDVEVCSVCGLTEMERNHMELHEGELP